METPEGLSRREAIKKAAIAGGAAGVVWSAPKIQGLSMRPNYAAAGSGSFAQPWSQLSGPSDFNPGLANCPGREIDFQKGTLGKEVKLEIKSSDPAFVGCNINIDGITGGYTFGPYNQDATPSVLKASRFIFNPDGLSEVDVFPADETVSGNWSCTA